jgi:hypothetical protein
MCFFESELKYICIPRSVSIIAKKFQCSQASGIF